MTQSIQPYQPQQIAPAVETFSTELRVYLSHLGLPDHNVLVEINQRRVLINNMPTVLDALNEQQRQGAMYISKFVAACAVGLFDAALNYLWDETIRNLRERAARFDLEYFFDSVTNDQDRRSKLRTEGDLEKLDDWELIRACRTTGREHYPFLTGLSSRYGNHWGGGCLSRRLPDWIGHFPLW